MGRRQLHLCETPPFRFPRPGVENPVMRNPFRCGGYCLALVKGTVKPGFLGGFRLKVDAGGPLNPSRMGVLSEYCGSGFKPSGKGVVLHVKVRALGCMRITGILGVI